MKTILRIILASVLITATSCDKEELAYQDEYEKSYKAWLDFKKESNNSYAYTMLRYHDELISTLTTITVESGTVIGREFRYHFIGNVAMPEGGWDKQTAIDAFKSFGYSVEWYSQENLLDQLQWTENREEIGTHQYGGIWTLDEVYKLAKNNWFVKRKNAETYFQADNNGMISSCGYVENGCYHEGCSESFIRIVSIEKLGD